MRHYAAAGVDGLVVCGSTGEAAALDDAEQLAVLDAVLNVADGLPVMMGLAGNHQGHVLRRLSAFGTRRWRASWRPRRTTCGPDRPARPPISVAWPTPRASRWRCTTFPTAPARRWTRPRCWSWRRTNIAAIKDCGGSLEKTVALIADGRLQVMAGEDLQTLSTLCLGGSGIIAAAAHIRPDLFVALYRAVREQRLDQTRALFLALAPMIQLAFAEPNPGPVKAQLARQGLLTDELRAPCRRPAPRWRTACRRRWPSWTARFRRVERGAGVCRPRGWGVRQALSASDSFGNTCLPGC